ncbi:hypothetical protein GCM10023212_06570 [Luteolibacter yonseiensis]
MHKLATSRQTEVRKTNLRPLEHMRQEPAETEEVHPTQTEDGVLQANIIGADNPMGWGFNRFPASKGNKA